MKIAFKSAIPPNIPPDQKKSLAENSLASKLLTQMPETNTKSDSFTKNSINNKAI